MTARISVAIASAFALAGCMGGSAEKPSPNELCAADALRDSYTPDGLKITDTRIYYEPSADGAPKQVSGLGLSFASDVVTGGQLSTEKNAGVLVDDPADDYFDLRASTHFTDGGYAAETFSTDPGAPADRQGERYAEFHPAGVNLRAFAAEAKQCFGELKEWPVETDLTTVSGP